MVKIGLTCPTCNIENEHTMNNFENTILVCPSCKEAQYLYIKANVVPLTAGAVASMSVTEILNATTIIGGFLNEVSGFLNEVGRKETLEPIKFWESANHAVDKLEQFAEKIRVLCKSAQPTKLKK